MRFSHILFGVFTATLLCAQSQGPQKVLVAGTVVNTATGQPLSGTLVSMIAIEQAGPELGFRGNEEQRVVTDASGHFSFQATSPSSVSLSATRQGFQIEDNSDAARLVLPNNFGDAVLRLVPRSVITGRIVNEVGEPLPDVTVIALQNTTIRGRRLLRNQATAVTDDRGIYRMWDLPPGSYYVNAAGRGVGTIATGGTPVFPAKREAYGPVYFPRASSEESAQILRLSPGASVNADFALESHESYRIRGQVTGMPAGRRIAIRLFRGDDVVVGRSALATASGAFEMTDVAAGSYTVQVATENGSPQGFGETPVTVGTADVSGVKVALGFGTSITGRVIFDGAPRREEEGLTLHVTATPIQTRRRPAFVIPEYVPVDPEGKFSFKSLVPGQYEIAIESSSSGRLVSATAAGRDILAEGLAVTAAGAPELELHLQSGGGVIEAAIDGYAGPGAINVLLLQRQGAQIPSVQMLFAEQPATFSGLTPGDYTLYAWRPGSEPEYRNQAALDLLRAYAAPVALSSGETKKVSLKIIPAEVLP